MSDYPSYQTAKTKQNYVPGFPRKTIIAFLAFSLCLAAAGYRYYQSEHDRYTRDKFHQLSAIITLKKGQIETWRTERLSDANFIFRNDAIAREARAVMARGRSTPGPAFVPEWMKSMYNNHHYSVIALYDGAHDQVLAYPDTPIAAAPALDSLITAAARGRCVLFSDFYRDGAGHPALAIVIPMLVRTASAPEPVGTIVLHINPQTTLYPLLQSWPIPSPSSELLLLRCANGNILFLNSLRFRMNAAVAYTESPGETQLLAARACTSADSLIEGLDYRAKQTIAVSRPVEGTAWTLVAKTDAEETYAPLEQTGFFLRVIVILLTLIGGISIISVWRHRRGLYYRRSYLQELERKSLERQIEYLVKYANDIIIVSDEAMNIVDVNDKAVEAYGYSRDELLTRPIETLRAAGHLSLDRRYEQLIAERGSALFETEHRRKDGTKLFVEVSVRVIEIEGKKYFQSIIRDITERKGAESALRASDERFRMLVDSLDEIVYTLDTGHRLLSVYGSWVEQSGFEAGTLLGKTVAEVYGPEGYENHRTMEDRALKGEHVLYESTYVDGPSKTLHDIQISLSPLRDPSDAIVGVVGIGRDITKMHRLERDLLQSQKMDSLGKLAGGIAHDFNNLLAMLMGSAEMLKRNLHADAVNSVHIRRILEATDRGSSIAKRLLLFSRQGEEEFQAVSVSHILNEVSEMLRHSFPKSIALVLNIQVDDGIVNGDAGHLHQAFVNLCLNARDAMGDHGTMTLTERTVDAAELREKYPKAPAGKYVAVSIADTGTGVDPALRSRIFEPFFTTKENGKGTGLGLSIVDGIIRSHHGYIDVQTGTGAGTTFTLYIPAFSAPVEPVRADEGELHGNGETILVVDDETVIRELLSEFLLESGYAVLAAADGEEALALYGREGGRIDLVITDLGMPNMSGEELFNRLRKVNPSVAVVISSGYLDGTTRNELLGKGIVDVMTKPYRLRDIQKILHRHFGAPPGRV